MNRFRLSKAQKARIAETMTLRKGVSVVRVLAQVEKSAHQYMRDYYDNESGWKTLDSSLKYHPWRKRGKVKQRALREYLKTAVVIHNTATGRSFGRNNSARYDKTAPYDSAGDKQKEKPHPFIVACLAAIHKRYTPKVFQDALHELKNPEASN